MRSSVVSAAVSMSVMVGRSLPMIIPHGVAVDTGQIAVENHDLVVVSIQLGGGIESVVRDVDGETLVAQALGDVVGQTMHVFDDQESHVAAAAVSAGRLATGTVIVTRSPPCGRACRHTLP